MSIETGRFTKNDSGFVCANCGFEVEPLEVTSRNHCPRCLCSLHVDIFPGDRANDCGGILSPIGCEISPKKGYVIIHKCRKCGAICRNKAATRNAKSKLPPEQYDDENLLIKLTSCHGL